MNKIYLLIGMVCIGLLANNVHAKEPIEKAIVESISTDIPCFETEKLMKQLRGSYREVPFLYGKTSDAAGTVMTVWVNPLTKTWTIIATKDTLSCVIGYGIEMNLVPYPKGPNI